MGTEVNGTSDKRKIPGNREQIRDVGNKDVWKLTCLDEQGNDAFTKDSYVEAVWSMNQKLWVSILENRGGIEPMDTCDSMDELKYSKNNVSII